MWPGPFLWGHQELTAVICLSPRGQVMSIIPDFNKPEIDEIAADMPPVYCQLSETTLQLCLHLLTRQPESEAFWTLAGDDFNDVLRDYVYLAQKELIDAMNPVARDIIFVPYKDVTETNTQDAIEQLEDIKEDIGAAAAVSSDLADHEALTNNPHSVTAAQAGADPSGSAAAVASDLADHLSDVSAKNRGFSARMSSSQSISNGVWTKINFNTEDFDTHGKYNTGTYRFTPGLLGKYLVTLELKFLSMNDQTGLNAAIYKNGVLDRVTTITVSYLSTGDIVASLAAIIEVTNIADYIEGYGIQFNGNSRSVDSSKSFFQAWYLGE